MVIQSSKPIIHYLPSLPCHNVYDIAIITINKSTTHKPTDKLYITCFFLPIFYSASLDSFFSNVLYPKY